MIPCRTNQLLTFLIILLLAPACGFGNEDIAANPAFAPISLAGQWRFKPDRQREGLAAAWFNTSLPGQIQLPGSCEQRGYGTPPPKPYLGRLTPRLIYDGPAWYQRDIAIPASWQGKRVELYLERCLWESTVWLDGREIGTTQNSLSTPHVYDLGPVAPGAHVLTICIDNTYKLKIGTWASAITDDTQGRWNGIIGRIELRATDLVWVEDLQVYPDYEKKSVRVKARLGNSTGQNGAGLLQVRLTPPGGSAAASLTAAYPVNWTRAGGTFDMTLPLPPLAAAPLSGWNEFQPCLYRINVGLTGSASEVTSRFGLRALAPKDGQILVNGLPTLLRGAVDECVYPLTGYPPMDQAAWSRVLTICQSYGFNYMRFHSWCPPEAAFAAADELGFLFQVELPFWTIDAPAFGQDPARDQFERDELNRILDCFGNHPSFGIMAMGNESAGPLNELTAQGHARDDRHLYRAEGRQDPNGGYTEGGTRGIYGPRTDWDRHSQAGGWIVNGSGNPPASALPLIGHEVGQWAMYPNFDQLKEFTGFMQPDNYQSYRKSLAHHGMADQDKAFADASGALSVLLYKDEIEGCFRTWPLGGFQVLEARDYPGQGTALVGWLDCFWKSKGLISPAHFRQFCAPAVCLLRLPQRVWTTADTFQAQAEVSNYGPAELHEPIIWSISDGRGQAVAQGTIPSQALAEGRVTAVGMIQAPLSGVAAPARLIVKVALGQTGIENSWNIWVYPAQLPPVAAAPHPFRIVHDFEAATRAALAAGERVLLFSSPQARANAIPGSFMPVFWCTRLFRQTGTMGILCDPAHPALAEFPTESHSDWEWADLLGRFSAAESFLAAGAPASIYERMYQVADDVSDRSKAIILDGAPAEYRPIVQVIDNYDRNHKLGALFEARAGAGSLLVCALDLETGQERRPAARQLYRSLTDYIGGDRFQPRQSLTLDYLQGLLARSDMDKLGAYFVSVDSQMDGRQHAGANAVDGDPATFWHTPWGARATPFPHELVVGLARPAWLAGCTLLARQEGPANGMIKGYAIYASADGKSWGSPVAQGELAPVRTPQRVSFPAPVQAQYVKLVARSGFNHDPFVALAEFTLVPAVRQ